MKAIRPQRAAAPADPNKFDSTRCLKITPKPRTAEPAEILDPRSLNSTILPVRKPSLYQTPHAEVPADAKRAILYARVSTSDGRQSVQRASCRRRPRELARRRCLHG